MDRLNRILLIALLVTGWAAPAYAQDYARLWLVHPVSKTTVVFEGDSLHVLWRVEQSVVMTAVFCQRGGVEVESSISLMFVIQSKSRPARHNVCRLEDLPFNDELVGSIERVKAQLEASKITIPIPEDFLPDGVDMALLGLQVPGSDGQVVSVPFVVARKELKDRLQGAIATSIDDTMEAQTSYLAKLFLARADTARLRSLALAHPSLSSSAEQGRLRVTPLNVAPKMYLEIKGVGFAIDGPKGEWQSVRSDRPSYFPIVVTPKANLRRGPCTLYITAYAVLTGSETGGHDVVYTEEHTVFIRASFLDGLLPLFQPSTWLGSVVLLLISSALGYKFALLLHKRKKELDTAGRIKVYDNRDLENLLNRGGAAWPSRWRALPDQPWPQTPFRR